MLWHTVIAVGYSNVSPAQMKSFAQKTYPDGGCEVKSIPDGHEEPRPYELGKAEAEEMARKAFEQYGASLCIGIMCVRFAPLTSMFNSSKLDIAMIVEQGVSRSKEFTLNPVSCKRTMVHQLNLGEHIYAHEAANTLIELIRTRNRSRLLQHF